MLKTKLVIEVEAKNNYTEKEIQVLSEQICNFLAGPDGEGLTVGEKYGGGDKTFEVLKVSIKRPEEDVWNANISPR